MISLPNNSYIICSTPRTGSTLLCSLLKSTGIAGNPESYFRRQDLSRWACDRSKILVSTESKEEADRLFTGLSAGGEVEGSMGDSPWGSYAAMFRDKYGIEWIIEFSSDK